MEKKQRSLRKKRALDELEGEEEAQGVSTEDVKLVQKQRQRKLVSCCRPPARRPPSTTHLSALPAADATESAHSVLR